MRRIPTLSRAVKGIGIQIAGEGIYTRFIKETDETLKNTGFM